MEGVQSLKVERDEARKMYLKYLTHRNYQSPLDADIARIYKAIAAGKLVIAALSAIVKAGLGSDHYPKLAIARADAKKLYLQVGSQGACAMISDERWLSPRMAKTRYAAFEAGSFPGINGLTAAALVPHIPPDIRPRRGIENYHVLFEAVWKHEAPVDPLLLRRLGGGDMWIVLGAWDLTDVERAVMMEHASRRQ